jgi:hypothetical protein
MMIAMALWQKLVIARPVAVEIQAGQPQNTRLPEFLLRLISSFADYSK